MHFKNPFSYLWGVSNSITTSFSDFVFSTDITDNEWHFDFTLCNFKLQNIAFCDSLNESKQKKWCNQTLENAQYELEIIIVFKAHAILR